MSHSGPSNNIEDSGTGGAYQVLTFVVHNSLLPEPKLHVIGYPSSWELIHKLPTLLVFLFYDKLSICLLLG